MLPTTYYLDNFLSLVGFVEKTYQELLTTAERRWFDSVSSASPDAQCLYVRLLSRKGELFRQAKLHYEEIADIEAAVCELAKLKLISRQAPDELALLCEKFTKAELARLSTSQLDRQLKRPQVVEHILLHETPSQLHALQAADQWVRVIGQREYVVFCLCFFGNGYQDASEFVLRDLGLIQYETYSIDQHSRVFQNRPQINAHLQLLDSKIALDLVDQTDVPGLLAVIDSLPDTALADEHLCRRVDRIRYNVARQLERLAHNEDALAIYQQSTHHPCRERSIRILFKQGHYKQALALCRLIEQSPLCEEELQFVGTIMPKLAKALALKIVVEKPFKPLSHKLTLSPANERVETITRDFYTQFGDCYYVENTLFSAVLGLFIWDIVFLSLPGVFYNPFQSGPSDFYQPEFTKKRQTELQSRFTELQNPLLFSARVWENYESKFGLANPLVHWAHLSEALLSKALLRIPPEHWQCIFDRMLKDLRNHTSGLPDLILFPSKEGYELLEVKGPGDVIQKNQRRWMSFFSEHRIPYRVIHIRWAQKDESM